MRSLLRGRVFKRITSPPACACPRPDELIADEEDARAERRVAEDRTDILLR